MKKLIDQQVKAWIDDHHRPCIKWTGFCCSIGAVACGVKAAEIISAKTDDYMKCEQLHNKIEFRIIEKKPGSVKLFIYNERAMNNILDKSENRWFLFKLGYYEQRSNKHLVDQLVSRLRSQDDFPHEIGLFLGYPLNDVLGFMGYSDKPLVKTKGWRMYGDIRNSEELYNRITSVKKEIRNYVENLEKVS